MKLQESDSRPRSQRRFCWWPEIACAVNKCTHLGWFVLIRPLKKPQDVSVELVVDSLTLRDTSEVYSGRVSPT